MSTRTAVFFAFLVFCLSGLAAAGGIPGASVQDEKPTVRLDRWVPSVIDLVSEVSPGVLRLGGRGWIRTPDEYLDFVFRVRIRVVKADAEGAVLLRAWREITADKPKTGYRLGFRGPKGKPPKAILTGYSEPVTVVSAATPALPAFEVNVWHEIEARCEFDRVTVTLDGHVVGEFEGREPQAGLLGMELHEGSFECRDLRVTPTEPKVSIPGPPPNPGAGRTMAPRPLTMGAPRYTLAGHVNKVWGLVLLEVEVLATGEVGNVTVKKSLNCDVDLEAIAAVRRWRYAPATRDGQPVPARVTISLAFGGK